MGQRANQSGFIHPYDVSSFTRLYERQLNCVPVCVPFYVLHKMLAGIPPWTNVTPPLLSP